MKSILIAIDLQRDFIDGALGTPEAAAIVPAAAAKLRAFPGPILLTLDTHGPDYLETAEGCSLPVPHCVRDTPGWQLHPDIQAAVQGRAHTLVEKPTFGSVQLPDHVLTLAGEEPFSLELIGLCTDICVVSNALLLKAHFPHAPIRVDARCCAGVTPDSHRAALQVMAACQVEIVGA